MEIKLITILLIILVVAVLLYIIHEIERASKKKMVGQSKLRAKKVEEAILKTKDAAARAYNKIQNYKKSDSRKEKITESSLASDDSVIEHTLRPGVGWIVTPDVNDSFSGKGGSFGGAGASSSWSSDSSDSSSSSSSDSGGGGGD